MASFKQSCASFDEDIARCFPKSNLIRFLIYNLTREKPSLIAFRIEEI